MPLKTDPEASKTPVHIRGAILASKYGADPTQFVGPEINSSHVALTNFQGLRSSSVVTKRSFFFSLTANRHTADVYVVDHGRAVSGQGVHYT